MGLRIGILKFLRNREYTFDSHQPIDINRYYLKSRLDDHLRVGSEEAQGLRSRALQHLDGKKKRTQQKKPVKWENEVFGVLDAK